MENIPFSHAAILHECATKMDVIEIRFSFTDPTFGISQHMSSTFNK